MLCSCDELKSRITESNQSSDNALDLHIVFLSNNFLSITDRK